MASKRPQVFRQMNHVANDLHELQIKEARLKIMTLLTASPSQVLPCLHALETKFFEKKETGAKAAEWPSTYMRCDQIPKYWLAAVLSEMEPELTESKLRSIDQFEKDSIRKILEFATGMRPMNKLPRICLKKSVLKLTLMDLYKQHGRRLANGWVGEAISMEGDINWAEHGVFSFAMDDAKVLVKEVCHISGSKAFIQT